MDLLERERCLGRLPEMQQGGSRAAALTVPRRSLVLLLRDLNCCVAAVRLRFVVCGQRGLIDLCHRRADGVLHARLEAHVSRKITVVERSTDRLGCTFQALIQHRGALAAREIEVGEVDDYRRHVLWGSGVGRLKPKSQCENHHRGCEAIHGSLLCMCRFGPRSASPVPGAKGGTSLRGPESPMGCCHSMDRR